MLLSTGCFTRVLRADFNEYAGAPVDELLNGSIPGIPDGDFIQNTQSSAVVVDEVIEDKSVRIRGQLELFPAEHDTPDEYIIDWVGFREFIGNSGNSTISFLDNDGDAALVLEFDGELGRINILSGTEFAPPVPVGSLIHVIEISINMTGLGSVDFSYQESDDPPDELNNLEFLDEDFDELENILFEGASNATYYMNDLDVFTRTDR
jgi:hypothetical protein